MSVDDEVNTQNKLARRLRETPGVISVRQRHAGDKLYISVRWRRGDDSMRWRRGDEPPCALVREAFPGAVTTSGSYGPDEAKRTWRLNP